MPLNSINTNYGAMIALQNLNATNAELLQVQTRIATGKKVNSVKDDPSTWAIAQNMRGRVSALDAVTSSLQRGESAVDVAISAGESVSDLLMQMKQKALAASDASLDTTSRNALAEDFKSIRDQITRVVNNASFNGVNLVKAGSAGIQALANENGTSRLTVQAQNLSLGGPNITFSVGATFTDAASASAMISALNASMTNVNTALTRLGTGSRMLASHETFIGKLQDSLNNGIGDLVDADLAKESARLEALQIKQQLGIQALAIANNYAQSLLALFR